MGEKNFSKQLDPAAVRDFVAAILDDIRALEAMIDRGIIETGIRRVGAEQEMFLVDEGGRAAPAALDVMEALAADPRFQTEVALFNLEANLDPQVLSGNFLSVLESQLNDALNAARTAAKKAASDVVLTGILPTLRRDDLRYRNLTPEPRYERLNEVSLAAQGGRISIAVDGLDHFEDQFDTVVVEGANTSLQLHLQVSPDEAAKLYNLAQLITAPLIAVATNSPVLLGKRVWQETRVAVFERALDDRSASKLAREVPTRVGFGAGWLKNSLVELFRDNVARFGVIMTRDADEDPMALLERGEIPRLRALNLHNGTVWRWNRPCFGLTNGKPHLRIESRILPAGPTVLDEVANAALFYGLMLGLADSYGDVSQRLHFSQAKENFIASAQHGLNAEYCWLDNRQTTARELLLEELLPAARAGLADVDVPAADIDRYLGVIQGRAESGQTGASWLLKGLAAVPMDSRPALCRSAVSFIQEMQQSETPVHEWPPIVAEAADLDASPQSLGEVMTRDVFTVAPGDLLDLATSMMAWQHFRHVPVEDNEGRLLGLLSARHLLQLRDASNSGGNRTAAESVMNKNPLTAPPGMSLADGIAMMLDGNSGCILIVRGERLIGIVTERDLLRVAARQLELSSGN